MTHQTSHYQRQQPVTSVIRCPEGSSLRFNEWYNDPSLCLPFCQVQNVTKIPLPNNEPDDESLFYITTHPREPLEKIQRGVEIRLVTTSGNNDPLFQLT
ncbi:hypothetical protein HAX54_015672, partial [Datura stramonium]|nr:hypothetical protein [Datura stramonium]